MKQPTWLDNFAMNYKKIKDGNLSKTASKENKSNNSSILVNLDLVKNTKVGNLVNYKNGFYKVADLEYKDEKGTGAVLTKLSDDEMEDIEAEKVPVIDNEEEYSINDDENQEQNDINKEQEFEDNVTDNTPMDMAMGTDKYQVGSPIPSSEHPQEYARKDPGDVYMPVDVRDDVEKPKFESEAQETEDEIKDEDSIDKTTMENHYTKFPRLRHEDDSENLPVFNSPSEDEVNEENSEEPVSTEEVKTESVTEEPIEEPIEKEPIESSINTGTVEVPKRINRILRRIMSSK